MYLEPAQRLEWRNAKKTGQGDDVSRQQIPVLLHAHLPAHFVHTRLQVDEWQEWEIVE